MLWYSELESERKEYRNEKMELLTEEKRTARQSKAEEEEEYQKLIQQFLEHSKTGEQP